MPHAVRHAAGLLRSGQFRELKTRISNRLYRRWVAYGLRRDITVPITAPTPKIPIEIRELVRSDIPLLFTPPAGCGPEELNEIKRRLAHVERGIPRCFVAVDRANGRPCFVQWLMGSEHNAAIAEHFEGRFPLLRKDEALLENAFTPFAYRGKGIMAAAMAHIAERAADIGARYVMTFVLHDNVASLKGSFAAGFAPYLIRRDTHFLLDAFHRRSFEAVPPGFEISSLRAANRKPALRLGDGVACLSGVGESAEPAVRPS